MVKENIMYIEEQERILTDQKTIEWDVRKFYWMLYRKQEVEITTDEIRNLTGHIKKISNAEKARLEHNIQMDELSKCLKNTRNNIAPVCGGFLGAFYKVFWCFLKNVFLGAVHQILEDKQLPKRSKDRRYITNWRPLTLLEILYKLLSAALALRLKSVLNNLLGADQKACIPGWFISKCTLQNRTTYQA